MQDSLGPVSRVVGEVLGPDHAVAQMLRTAAEANLSAATLTALRARERIQQVPAPISSGIPHLFVLAPYFVTVLVVRVETSLPKPGLPSC